MSDEARRQRVRAIAEEDVDDVVGVATELERAEERRIDVEDVKAIASDLRIDPRFVEPAIETLERTREEQRAAAAAATARRARAARIGGLVLAVALALASVGALVTRSSLAPRLAEVERQEAQVRSVIERRARIEAIWAEQPPSRDRDAELAGAENRVGIERRRYDEAAADYNASASGLPSALFCGITGVPCRVPLSSEVQW